jgi:hypothetical protein
MHQLIDSFSYDPNRLLGAMLRWMQKNSDKILSCLLKVSTQIIRSMRTGRLLAGVSMLLWMVGHVVKSVEELRRIIGDRHSKVRLPCCIDIP